MSFDFFVARGRDQLPISGAGDLVTDHRARIAHERQQELERKQQEVLEQISGRNTPSSAHRDLGATPRTDVAA